MTTKQYMKIGQNMNKNGKFIDTAQYAVVRSDYK